MPQGQFSRTLGGKAAIIAALAAVYFLGCYVRLLPLPNFISFDGSVYLLEGDNYEHLRKVETILADYPNFPVHDYYLGFPKGTGNITTAFLDLTFASIIKPLLPFFGGADSLVYLMAVIPPYIGMLAVVPFFLWIRAVFGLWPALIGSLLTAILPPLVFNSLAGRPDNELMEPLCAATLFYLQTLSLREAEGGGHTRKLALFSFLAGLTAFISVLYWRGAILWWGMIAAHNFLILVFPETRQKAARYWLSGVVLFVTAGALTAIASYFRLMGLSGGMRFNTVSWFHVVLSVISIAALSAAAAYSILNAKGRGRSSSALSGAAVLLASAILIHLIVPDFFNSIFKGLSIVGGAEKWTSEIAQYKPLFTDPSGAFSLIMPIKMSTAFILLAPLVLLWLSAPSRIRRKGAAYSLFVFASWGLLALAFRNGRYENVFAIVAAACGGVFLYGVYSAVRKRLKSAAGAFLGAASAIGCFALLAYPALPAFRGIPTYKPIVITGDLEDALIWLRLFTPETSNYLTPQIKPEYGIMARWEFGGWIEYVAKRPSIATLYGIETHGLRESAAFFLATDEKELLGILDENQARYFILTKLVGELRDYADILGRDPDEYISLETGEKGSRWNTGKKFFDLLFTRLYYFDGQPGGPVRSGSVSGVRLVYESTSQANINIPGQTIRQYKIFERVSGAMVSGAARPGEKVTLEGVVITNQKRTFPLYHEATAGGDGQFAMKAYYPTVSPEEHKTGVVGYYTLNSGGVKRQVSVTEADVIEGGEVNAGR